MRDSFAQAACGRAAAARAVFEILGLAAVAGAATAVLAGAPWLAWTAAAAAMAVWHVGMLDPAPGGRVRGLGLANGITLGRALAIPLLATPLGRLVVVCGLVSDAADGALARRRMRETRFGRWADSTTDAVFVPAAAVALAAQHRLAWWASLLVVGRYVTGTTIIAVSSFRSARVPDAALVDPWRWPAAATALGLLAASAGAPDAVLLIVVGAAGSLAGLAGYSSLNSGVRAPGSA